MKKDCVSCCPFLSPSRETKHFCLLALLIALYMLAGAAVFSSLERPAEIQAHRLWESRLTDFSQRHGVSSDDLKLLLRFYEEARAAGIRTDDARALWDISGAFYFVGTVLSTIGFGVSAPSTVTGKVLLVFYGLLGCSATILFFNLFLERVITLLSLHMSCCCRGRGGARSGSAEWKPSVYQVTLILFIAVLLVAFAAAFVYSAMEGWTYLESLYFCFVAFSTVGFGDFVSSQKAQHEDTRVYQVVNCLLMLFGVCCTYSLFNAISVLIKQGLNWLLNVLAWMYQGICRFRRQLRPHLKLQPSDSERTIYCGESDTLPPMVSSLAHSLLWRSCAPAAVGKCLCDEASVETVSRTNSDHLRQNQDISNSNAAPSGQLPTCLH